MISEKELKQELKRLDLDHVKGMKSEMEFFLWDLSKMDEWNKNYKVESYLSGFYAIGTDGGGEMLTVELKSGFVYTIPFISIDSSEKIKVSDSIIELVKLNK